MKVVGRILLANTTFSSSSDPEDTVWFPTVTLTVVAKTDCLGLHSSQPNEMNHTLEVPLPHNIDRYYTEDQLNEFLEGKDVTIDIPALKVSSPASSSPKEVPHMNRNCSVCGKDAGTVAFYEDANFVMCSSCASSPRILEEHRDKLTGGDDTWKLDFFIPRN